MRDPGFDIEVNVKGEGLRDHEVLVVRPNKKPVIESYQQAAERVTYAMQQSAFRDGIKAVLGAIDLSRMCFAVGLVRKGKARDKEFTLGAETLERMLREVCEKNGVQLPDFPEGVKAELDGVK